MRNPFARGAFGAVILLVAATLRADQTYPPGTILSGDVTWTTGEVITILGTSSFRGHVVIEPGVSVRSAAGASIYLEEGGEMTGNGTAANPIRFEGIPDPAPAPYWGGIVVAPGTLTLHHAILTHARNGIEANGVSVVTLDHCAITDIVGVGGTDGAPGQNGGDTSQFFATQGVGLRNGAYGSITDTVIDGVRAGSGGRGGNGDPLGGGANGFNGGRGGSGGYATGVGFSDSGDFSLIFERNVIANVYSGDGGKGGDGVLTGIGGAGGNAVTCYAVYLADASNTLMRNFVIHDVAPGAGGKGGAKGPDSPGMNGSDGEDGELSAVRIYNSPVRLEHGTIDAVGTPGRGFVVAVSAYTDTPLLSSLHNCTISNIAGKSFFGLRQQLQATINTFSCNFYNPGGPITNVATESNSVSFIPGFVNAGAGDYHLAEASPLTDIGADTETTDDLDGQLRDATPDIGADEFVTYVGRDFGDFDGNHCTDIQDFLFLLDNWTLDLNGTPVGINDFLSLLDYWTTGTGCM